jgi:transitional endoplasmic reticulum ATPase
MKDPTVTVSFDRMKSRKYRDAVAAARQFSTFTEASDAEPRNVVLAPVSECLAKRKLFEELYDLIKGWAASSVKLEGEELRPYELFNRFGAVLRCAEGFADMGDRTRYCAHENGSEGWSCRHLTAIKRHLDKQGYYLTEYWYKFGKFISEGVWQIDRLALTACLAQEATEKELHCCPYFSMKTVRRIVSELPDEIDTRGSDYWDIVYREDFFGTEIKMSPVGVRHRSASGQGQRKSGSGGVSFKDGVLRLESSQRTRYIPAVTFEDIGGVEKVIEQIREVIELPLKRPDIYQHLGIVPHKGILFYGESGNGKTLIAKAIANETDAHFIPVSGSELISKWYGESESNLRDVFDEAREMQPSIIFFDEIDSVAQHRSDADGARVESRFVNELLVMLDGMESYENVMVLASTNRPDLLDEALLRPGRFDYKIEVAKPDEAGCLSILGISSRDMPLEPSLELKALVPLLLGRSGADIAFVAKEAAMNALRRTADITELIKGTNKSAADVKGIRVSEADFRQALKKLDAYSL